MASVYGSTPFDELTETGWDRDLSINVKSAFLCAKAAIPVMRATGGGASSTSPTGWREADGPTIEDSSPTTGEGISLASSF
jgi:NAD(P)-dependent dehydrogenase (short-subunit alcohol dehydrogenase family)